MATWRMLTGLLIAGACAAGAADAGTTRGPGVLVGLSTLVPDVVIPIEWSGIWEVESVTYDCDTNQPLGSAAYDDTLCAGGNVDFFDPGFEITCTGTADGNTVTGECTGSFEVVEDCVAEFSNVYTATRTGETYESVSTVSMTYVGAGCLFIPDSCRRTESTGTRIAPEPVPCDQTPVESVAWGTIKSLYR